MKFVSMHSLGRDPIDCRLLQIEFNFSKATLSQVKDLAKYCVFEVEALLEDAFFLDWRWRNNRCTNIKSLINRIEEAGSFYKFSLFGNEHSSGIDDYKSLRRYDQKLSQELMFSKEDMTTVSENYWETYYELFSNISDAEEIKQNLLRLFRKENVFFKKAGVWSRCRRRILCYGI